MHEFMYGFNSAWIAGALLLSIALAIEAGFRIARRLRAAAELAYLQHVNNLMVSLLGLLALLLGFSLSLSLQRYDSRSEAVVAEANAIGTAALRAQLLPAALREETQRLLRDYTDLRVQDGAIMPADTAGRAALRARTDDLQRVLWAQAREAAALAPNPVTALYLQALNDLIDNFGRRDAELNRHVPEPVLLLLYLTYVVTGAIIGYASGIAGHRASVAAYIMVLLVTIVVFIILDLDRPRRGVILVSQDSLLQLQAGLRAPAAAAPPAPAAR